MKTKDEYISQLHKKIDEWNGDIDRLGEKLEKVDAESRAQLQEQIQTLKSKREEIEDKLSDLGDSGSEAWEDIKSGMELAKEAMNSAMQSAKTRFSK